jgi:antitoxin CptB
VSADESRSSLPAARAAGGEARRSLPAAAATPERHFARLRWRCRRGWLELDLVLARFLEEDYPTLGPAERRAFERLLALSDETLLAWLNGVEPVSLDEEAAEVVKRLRR